MSVGLVDIEFRVLDGLVMRGGLTVWQADGLRRRSPFHRDAFDSFIHRATCFAFDEGSWDTFAYGATTYLALTRESRDLTPALIPPEVHAAVDTALGQWAEIDDEPARTRSYRLPERRQHLAHDLLITLGGEPGDPTERRIAVSHAAHRAFSRMMSARISDGFVHPVIGAHIWSGNPADTTSLPGKGPGPAALRTLVEQWRTAPDDRPHVERRLLDHARTVGWANVRSAS